MTLHKALRRALRQDVLTAVSDASAILGSHHIQSTAHATLTVLNALARLAVAESDHVVDEHVADLTERLDRADRELTIYRREFGEFPGLTLEIETLRADVHERMADEGSPTLMNHLPAIFALNKDPHA